MRERESVCAGGCVRESACERERERERESVCERVRAGEKENALNFD